MDKDLFSSLSKYTSNQEENFLTEAFVHLINLILERVKTSGIYLLSKLMSLDEEFINERASLILISTQYSLDEGRPDIVVHLGNDSIFYIEVKHDSKIGYQQLERYYRALEKEQMEHKQLVLLTRSRHSIQETELEHERFHHVCWYEISGWLSDIEVEDKVAQYIIEEFLSFLGEKEMSMEKITWEFINGVPALRNLANMIGVAVAEALPEIKTRRTAGWNWIGYYLGEGTDLWVGFRYKDHMEISMENNNGNEPTFHRSFSFEEVHFFSLDAGEQLEQLIDFISASFQEYSQFDNSKID